jgi:hypothetical protein
MKLRLNIWFVFILLGLLLSYNLDLECLSAGNGACQQVCQEAAEDVCAEPSFGSAPLAALPSRPFHFETFLVQAPGLPATIFQEPKPSGPGSPLPLGLRAPPHFSVS